MPSYYGTVSGADAYHLARGNTGWTGTNDQKLAALTNGSTYVDGHFRLKNASGTYATLFSGVKTGGRAQERDWPRTGATDYEGNALDPNEVPIEIEHATYEAALIETTAPGSLFPSGSSSASASNGQVKRLKQKVDELEQETEFFFADNVAPPTYELTGPSFPEIDAIVAPLLVASSSAIPAVFVV